MSFDVTLNVRDTQGSLVAVRGNVNGELRMTQTAESLVTYAVRGAVATATASLTNGTSTSLLAGTAGEFHDLMEISFSNNSTAAVQVQLLDDGTAVRTFQAAASTITQEKFSPPVPANAAGGQWNVDMPDITGTTVTVNALFAKNS